MALLACSWVMALMIAPMSMRLSRNDHKAIRLADRGVSVDYTTVSRWTPRYAPEIEKRLHPHLQMTEPLGGIIECLSLRRASIVPIVEHRQMATLAHVRFGSEAQVRPSIPRCDETCGHGLRRRACVRSSSWGLHPKNRVCRCPRRNGAGSRRRL